MSTIIKIMILWIVYDRISKQFKKYHFETYSGFIVFGGLLFSVGLIEGGAV